MGRFRVTKEDSYDLGFADACQLSAAISPEEFVKWVYWVIENSDQDLPSYFFDLDSLSNSAGALYDAIGFVPSPELSDSEEKAIDGIAYKRGAYDPLPDYDVHISKEDALNALADNPQIEERFRNTFPFIEY